MTKPHVNQPAGSGKSHGLLYLSGVSTPQSRASERTNLAVLANPRNRVHTEVDDGTYAVFGADNGFYSLGSKSDATPAQIDSAVENWRAWLASEIAPRADRCLFATIPDHLDWLTDPDTGKRFPVGDAEKTLARYHDHVDFVRSLGLKAALVAQDGLRSEGKFLVAGNERVAWAQVDCLFIGGSDAFKLGPEAEALCREAQRRGVWVHVGRVNSWKRINLVRDFSDSVDGTFLMFHPTKCWPQLEGWLDRLDALEVAA